MSKPRRIHPAVLDAANDHRKGKMNRRDFLRFATLARRVRAGGLRAWPGVDRPRRRRSRLPAVKPPPQARCPARSSAAAPGLPPCSSSLLDHPARLSWVEGANIVRQINEYLTETGPDNITRPLLLDRWEASDDVKTWDLYLKQGIKFNNGDELTADDVMFTLGEWLNPDVGSSMLGLLASLGSMDNVEKVDDYHIRLNLNTATSRFPRTSSTIRPSSCTATSRATSSSSPSAPAPSCWKSMPKASAPRFKRREDYWRNGEDGQPLPYLDELIYVSTDKDAGVAALQSGQVDTLYDPRPTDFQALKDKPDLTVRPASTAQCLILRMRVDLEPWDDNRVRTALKMCQDRAKILQLSYFGEGDLSIDAHVAPVHPAYCEKPIPAYDPEGATALLEEYAAEKGIELPLKVTLATKNDQAEPEIAQALKELAEPAGFDITLDITEPGGYWDRWTEVDLGITSWTHRPLGIMVLPSGLHRGGHRQLERDALDR